MGLNGPSKLCWGGLVSDGEIHEGILPGVESLKQTNCKESQIHHSWPKTAIEPQYKFTSEHSVNSWLLKLSDTWTPIFTRSKRTHCLDFQPKLASEPPCKSCEGMVCILQKGKLVTRGASGVNSHVKPVLASPQINTSNSPKAPYNILIYIHRTSIDQIRDPLGIVS